MIPDKLLARIAANLATFKKHLTKGRKQVATTTKELERLVKRKGSSPPKRPQGGQP